jgi:hypothetical protein
MNYSDLASWFIVQPEMCHGQVCWLFNQLLGIYQGKRGNAMEWDGTYGYSKFGYPKNTIIDINVILTKIGPIGVGLCPDWENEHRMPAECWRIYGHLFLLFSSIHHAWWFPSEKYVFEGGLRNQPDPAMIQTGRNLFWSDCHGLGHALATSGAGCNVWY